MHDSSYLTNVVIISDLILIHEGFHMFLRYLRTVFTVSPLSENICYTIDIMLTYGLENTILYIVKSGFNVIPGLTGDLT